LLQEHGDGGAIAVASAAFIGPLIFEDD
jgi:hypothetical protein